MLQIHMAIRQVQVLFDTPRHLITHIPALGYHLTDMGGDQARLPRKRPLGSESGYERQQILLSNRPDSGHFRIIAICYGSKEEQPPLFISPPGEDHPVAPRLLGLIEGAIGPHHFDVNTNRIGAQTNG
jgi:hypothetical protein